MRWGCPRREGCLGLVSYSLRRLRSPRDLPSCLPPLATEAVRRSHRLAAAARTVQGVHKREESEDMHEQRKEAHNKTNEDAAQDTHTHTHSRFSPPLVPIDLIRSKDLSHLLLPVLHSVHSSRWCSCRCCSVYALDGEGGLLLPPVAVWGALVLLIAHAKPSEMCARLAARRRSLRPARRVLLYAI